MNRIQGRSGRKAPLGGMTLTLLLVMLAMMVAMPRTARAAYYDGISYDSDNPEREYDKSFAVLSDGGFIWYCMQYTEDGASNEIVLYGLDSGLVTGPVSVPDTIGFDGETYTVVGLISAGEAAGDDCDDGSFRDCSHITEMSLPSSVRFIGNSAFNFCSSLTSVTFRGESELESIEAGAFFGCKQLKGFSEADKMVIPPSVTDIEEYAFYGCSSIGSVTFSEGASVADTAVQDCPNIRSIENCPSYLDLTYKEARSALETVSYSPGIKTAEGFGSYDTTCAPELREVVLPEGIETIGSAAFASCTKLTSINFPSSLTTIRDSAFEGCSSLTGITELPTSVTEVGMRAFHGCTNLHMNVVHPGNSLRGQYANSGITNLTLSGDANWFTANEFLGCPNLESITVLPGGSGPFHSIDGVLYDTSIEGGDYLIKYPAAKAGTDFVVPDTCDGVGPGAFEGCALQTIHIPVTVLWLDTMRWDSQYYSYGKLDRRFDPFTDMLVKPTVYCVRYSDAYYDFDFGSIDSDVTLKYEPGPQVHIIYDLAGGVNNKTNPGYVVGGYSVTLANPTRSGYTFAGWKEYSERYDQYYDVEGGKLTPSFDALAKARITVKATWKVVKKANPLAVKAAKTKMVVKFAKVKKAKVTLVKNVKVTKKGVGKLTYANASKNKAVKKFVVNKTTGKVIVPKGTKKGTYLLKVKVTAAGNASYKAGSKVVSYKVIVN